MRPGIRSPDRDGPHRQLTARPPLIRSGCGSYLPHYASSGFHADFHADLFDRLSDLHTRRNAKEAIIAPREGAKSTVITLAYTLYCAAERHEPFTLILSDGSLVRLRNNSDTSALRTGR